MSASKRKRSRTDPVGLIVLAAAVVLLAAVVLSRTHGRSENEAEIREGVAYLENLEKGDTSDLEETIAEQRRKRMNEERELRLEQLTSGGINVWKLFGDSVILGDSRTVGFYFYEFLPEKRVLAESGDSITNIAEHIDEVKSLNPTLIFVCYGTNDVGMWTDIDEFIDNYRSMLRDLQKAVPNALIFVNSILSVERGVEEMQPIWSDIPDYNEAIRTMCSAEGYGYVDGDEVLRGHKDLYDVDGIHFVMDFYPYWAAQMMMTVYDTQIGESEAGSYEYEETAAEEEWSDEGGQS